MKKSRYVKLVPKDPKKRYYDNVAMKDSTFDKYELFDSVVLEGEIVRKKYFIFPLYEEEEVLDVCELCGGEIEPFLEELSRCLSCIKTSKWID